MTNSLVTLLLQKLERLKYDNVCSTNFWICCFSSTNQRHQGYFIYIFLPKKDGAIMTTGLGRHFASVRPWIDIWYWRLVSLSPYICHIRVLKLTAVTCSPTERREIRNFPYPSVFELTGLKDWPLKGGIGNVGQFLVAEVTNPGHNESQQMFAFCDRMNKEGDIQRSV